MPGFKWRQFGGEVILWAVRWYCRYGISYRELEEMLGERGVTVDHTTIYRWVQRYAPELEKRAAWYRSRISFSWRVDETYVRVKGHWKYLYRAIDKDGATLDFFLADRRNAKAAKRFLGAALKRSRNWHPRVINTDKNPAYSEAITELKKEGAIPKELEHRQVKYLNNRLEGDHGKLKRLIRPTLGFQSMRTARATIKGFEVMRMFKKGQFRFWIEAVGGKTEVSFINPCSGSLPESMAAWPSHHAFSVIFCNGAKFINKLAAMPYDFRVFPLQISKTWSGILSAVSWACGSRLSPPVRTGVWMGAMPWVIAILFYKQSITPDQPICSGAQS
jgi:transposase-like protein